MATQSTPATLPLHEKKPLVRRAAPDRSQRVRHIVQGAFLLLNGWLGAQFYLWVRYFERGGEGLYVSRPAGVEGWLPIAGLMNTKYFLSTGRIPAVHPAAMFLFLGFVGMSLFLKKSFCSWLCPVGTFSEFLAGVGRRVWGRVFRIPRWLDISLRGLKYLLLAFFTVFIGGMSAEALDGFMASPYGLMADVKMLNFFREMGTTAAIVIALLVVASTLVENFWCRYLCPYGALMGLVSLASPVKIRRDVEACIDCSKCAKACPAGLKVDQLVQIRSAECTACMACVASCPAENALQLALAPRRAETARERWARRGLRPAVVVAVIAYFFLGAVLFARATNHWKSDLSKAAYMELVPQTDQLSHPAVQEH
ncbi:MAG TPA: 4Fe-4S binding protein [Terracidiphilus sp.]|nr:4Fe-4S binding protein [Terracidiphilus sp.]